LEKLSWENLIQSMATSYDPKQHLKAKVDSYNASRGALDLLDCPKCLNRGNFAHCREDNTIVFSDCSCMKTRSAIQRMERSGLKQSIRDYTFDKFNATEPWQKDLKEGTMAYAKNPQGWLIICGQSGCGKTHLCTAICRERLLQQEDVHYMSWREDITRLKALSPDNPEREKLLKRLKTVQLLYIDDLFKTGADDKARGKPTAADVNLAFEILNYRYINYLNTVLSTELHMQDLLDVDEATGGRIAERASKHIYSVKSARSRNYRLRDMAVL